MNQAILDEDLKASMREDGGCCSLRHDVDAIRASRGKLTGCV